MPDSIPFLVKSKNYSKLQIATLEKIKEKQTDPEILSLLEDLIAEWKFISTNCYLVIK